MGNTRKRKTHAPIISKLPARLRKIRTLHQQPLMRAQKRLLPARPNHQRDNRRGQVLRKRDARRGRLAVVHIVVVSVAVVVRAALGKGKVGLRLLLLVFGHLDIGAGDGFLGEGGVE